MRRNPLIAIREIPKPKGFLMILGSVLIGLVLARFVMISPIAGIIVLSSGIVVTLTILLRKTDYLIFGWFVLTGLIYFILYRFFPAGYHASMGRAIFWGILVCVIVAWAIDNILSGMTFTPFDNMPLKVTILIFMLWCTMTLSTSLNVFLSVKKWSHIVIALVTSYMFYDFFSRDENNIKKLLKIVSLMVILISFVTVAVSIRALVQGVLIYKEITLWFWNPNLLGWFFATCTPLLITSGFDFRPIKRLKVFFVSLMLLGLFFSFARTSWLAVLVSISFLLWKGRTKLLLSVVIIPVLFVAGLTLPRWGGDFYNYATGPRYTGRREIWKAAWNTACDYPVLGTGLGNSTKIMPQYIDSPYLKREKAHSLYLQNAAEMGFISVVILLAIYVIFIFSSDWIERNLKSHYLRLAVRGTIATFLGLFVHDVLEVGSLFTSFDASEFSVMYPYILMGLPFAAKKLEEREEAG